MQGNGADWWASSAALASLLGAACICSALMWWTVGHGEDKPVPIGALVAVGVAAAVAGIVLAAMALTCARNRSHKALAIVGIALGALSLTPVGLVLLAYALGVGGN